MHHIQRGAESPFPTDLGHLKQSEQNSWIAPWHWQLSRALEEGGSREDDAAALLFLSFPLTHFYSEKFTRGPCPRAGGWLG